MSSNHALIIKSLHGTLLAVGKAEQAPKSFGSALLKMVNSEINNSASSVLSLEDVSALGLRVVEKLDQDYLNWIFVFNQSLKTLEIYGRHNSPVDITNDLSKYIGVNMHLHCSINPYKHQRFFD